MTHDDHASPHAPDDPLDRALGDLLAGPAPVNIDRKSVV